MLRTPSVFFFFLFPINDSACVNYHLLSFNSSDSQTKKKKKGFNSLQVVVTFFFPNEQFIFVVIIMRSLGREHFVVDMD